MQTQANVRKAISTAELERRWALARALLRDEGLDGLIVQNNNIFLGGYARWFTDVPAEYNHNMTILFHVDAPMSVIRSSFCELDSSYFRGVSNLINLPVCPSLSGSGKREAEQLARLVKKHGYTRLGYVGKALLSSGMMLGIAGLCPQLELVNMSDQIDRIKARKSPEEMEFLRETVRIHDIALAALPAIVRPGMPESEIRSELIRLVSNLGSEEQLLFMGTAKPGECSGMHTSCYVNRRVEKGDYGTILVEVSGPGGFYGEAARNFVLGEPSKQMAEDWQVAVEAQRLMQQMVKPGIPASDIVKSYNKYVSEKGYNEEDRLFGHSQGYDLVERPAMMRYYEGYNEDMVFEEGMFISLHPYFIDATRTIYINDNYYVGEDSTEKLNTTPAEIIII